MKSSWLLALLFVCFASLANNSLEQRYNHIRQMDNRKEQAEQLQLLINSEAFQASLDTAFKIEVQLRLSNYLATLNEANQANQIAFDLLKRLNDGDKMLHAVYYQLASNYYETAQYDKAEENLHIAIQLAKKFNDEPAQLKAIAKLSSVYRRTSRYQLAVDLVFEHLALAKAQTNNDSLENFYHQLALNLEHLSQYQLALEFKQKSHELNKLKPQTVSQQASDFYSFGQSYLDLGEYANAEVFFQKSLALDEMSGIDSDIGHSLLKLSMVYHGLGDGNKALAMAKKAQTYFEKHPRNTQWARYNEARALILLNELDQADVLVDEVISFLAPLKSDYHLYNDVLNTKALLNIKRDQLDNPYKLVDQSIVLSREHSFYKRELDSLWLKQTIAERLGDTTTLIETQKNLIELQTRLNEQRFAVYRSASQSDLAHQRKDLQITQLDLQRANAQAQLAQQQSQNAFNLTIAVVLIALVSILMGIFYYRRRLALQEKQFIEQLMEQKNALFADTSHDLRTPLTALSLSIEAMQHGLVPSNKEQLDNLASKVRTINGLINDISDLAKLNSHDIQMQFEPVNAVSFFQDICEDIKVLTHEHQFKFNLNLSPELEVKLDKKRVYQVVFNLISNSVKYTHKNELIELKASQTPTFLNLRFIDGAPGVPSDALHKLFDRNYRVNQPTGAKGCGLGLAIVKRIVELHKGTVTASPSSHGGLEVSIELPLS